jgi:hypothetical protein
VVDEDYCEREDAEGQKEAACQSSTHIDRHQNDSSFRTVALELTKMLIGWVHYPGCGSDLEMAEKYPSA